MGKIFKKCIVFMVSLLMVFSAVGCDLQGVNKKTYSLNKTSIEYTIGTDFSSVGLFLVNDNDSHDKIAVTKSMFSNPAMFDSECSNVTTEVNYKNKTYSITVTVLKSSEAEQQALRAKLNDFMARFANADNAGNAKVNFDIDLLAQFLNNEYTIDQTGELDSTMDGFPRFEEINYIIEKLVTGSLDEDFLDILNGTTMVAKIGNEKILSLLLKAVESNNKLVSSIVSALAKNFNFVEDMHYQTSEAIDGGTRYNDLSFPELSNPSLVNAYNAYIDNLVGIIEELENLAYGKDVFEVLSSIKTKFETVKTKAKILEDNLVSIYGIFDLSPIGHYGYGGSYCDVYGYSGLWTSDNCERYIEVIDLILPLLGGESSTHAISNIVTEIASTYGSANVYSNFDENELVRVTDPEILGKVDNYIDACLNLIVVFEDYVDSKNIDKFLADLTDAIEVINGYSEEFANDGITIFSNIPCVSLINNRYSLYYSVFAPKNTTGILETLKAINALKKNYSELKDGLHDPVHACSNALKLLDFVNDYSFVQKLYSYEVGNPESLELEYAYGREQIKNEKICEEADKYYQGIIDVVVAIENFASGSENYVSTLNVLKTAIAKIKTSSEYLINRFVSYGYGFYKLNCENIHMQCDGYNFYRTESIQIGVFSPDNCDDFILIIDLLLEIDEKVEQFGLDNVVSIVLETIKDYASYDGYYTFDSIEDGGWYDELYNYRFEYITEEDVDIKNAINTYNEACLNIVKALENIASGATAFDTLTTIKTNIETIEAQEMIFDENYVVAGFYPFTYDYNVSNFSYEYVEYVGYVPTMYLAERKGIFVHGTNQEILNIIDDLLIQINNGTVSWAEIGSYAITTYLLPLIEEQSVIEEEEQSVIEEIATYFNIDADEITAFIDTYKEMTLSGEALLNFDIKNFAYDIVHLIFGKSIGFQTVMNYYVDMALSMIEYGLNMYPVVDADGNTQLVNLVRDIIGNFNNSLNSKNQPNSILEFLSDLVYGGENSPSLKQIWSIIINNLTIRDLFGEDDHYLVVSSECAMSSGYIPGEVLIVDDVGSGQVNNGDLVAFYNEQESEVVGIGRIAISKLKDSETYYDVINIFEETTEVAEELIYGIVRGSTGIVIPTLALNRVGEGLFKQLILDSLDFISNFDMIGSFDTYKFVSDMADIFDNYLHTADNRAIPEDFVKYAKAFVKYQLGLISHKELTAEGKDLYCEIISYYVCSGIMLYDAPEFESFYTDVKQFIDDAFTDYIKDAVDVVKLVSGLVSIVNTYGSTEVRATVNTLAFLALYVYEYKYDVDVDYNSLFANFQLPEFITDCDFNALIDKMTTADTYENILNISDVSIHFVEENGQIVKEIMDFSVTMNFELADKFVCLTKLIGTVNLSLEIGY